MASTLPYKRGLHVVICGVSGEAVYSDEAVRRYDGLVVARKNLDLQHPQELRRTRPEKPARPPLNPEPADVFVAFPTLLLDEEDNDFLMDEVNAPIYVEA